MYTFQTDISWMTEEQRQGAEDMIVDAIVNSKDYSLLPFNDTHQIYPADDTSIIHVCFYTEREDKDVSVKKWREDRHTSELLYETIYDEEDNGKRRTLNWEWFTHQPGGFNDRLLEYVVGCKRARLAEIAGNDGQQERRVLL